MYSFSTHPPSHSQTAAVKDTKDTDPDPEARSIIVCGIKAVNKRQASLRSVAVVIGIETSGGEVAVRFRRVSWCYRNIQLLSWWKKFQTVETLEDDVSTIFRRPEGRQGRHAPL